MQYRLAVGGGTFVWPLARNGKTRRVTVDGRVMVNDADLATRAAVDGLGIAFTPETLAEPSLRSGQLVRVLEDWSPSKGAQACRHLSVPRIASTCSGPGAVCHRSGIRSKTPLSGAERVEVCAIAGSDLCCHVLRITSAIRVLSARYCAMRAA